MFYLFPYVCDIYTCAKHEYLLIQSGHLLNALNLLSYEVICKIITASKLKTGRIAYAYQDNSVSHIQTLKPVFLFNFFDK